MGQAKELETSPMSKISIKKINIGRFSEVAIKNEVNEEAAKTKSKPVNPESKVGKKSTQKRVYSKI